MRVIFEIFVGFGNDVRWLYGQASGAVDEIVSMKKPEGVVETLFAHVGQYFGLRGKEYPQQSVYVVFGYFYAGVRYVNLKTIVRLIKTNKPDNISKSMLFRK